MTAAEIAAFETKDKAEKIELIVEEKKDELKAAPDLEAAAKSVAKDVKVGRPKMTAEQEAAAKKARDEAAKQATDEVKSEAVAALPVPAAPEEAVEVREQAAEAEEAVQAKASFTAEYKRTAIEELRLYIKPEDHAAYYVVNEKCAGRVDL